jgi:hypothetical protein
MYKYALIFLHITQLISKEGKKQSGIEERHRLIQFKKMLLIIEQFLGLPCRRTPSWTRLLEQYTQEYPLWILVENVTEMTATKNRIRSSTKNSIQTAITKPYL